MTTDEMSVTRRGFVKGTAVAGAGLAMLGAAGAMTSADGWLVPAHAETAEGGQPVNLTREAVVPIAAAFARWRARCATGAWCRFSRTTAATTGTKPSA